MTSDLIGNNSATRPSSSRSSFDIFDACRKALSAGVVSSGSLTSTISATKYKKRYALPALPRGRLTDAEIPVSFTAKQYGNVPDFLKFAASLRGAKSERRDHVEWAKWLDKNLPAGHQRTTALYSNPNTRWCALLPAYVFASMGLGAQVPRDYPSALAWKNFGHAVQGEYPAGTVIVTESKTRPGGGHIGFYIGTAPDDPDQIAILSANDANSVSVSYISRRVVKAARWPDGVAQPQNAPRVYYGSAQNTTDMHFSTLYAKPFDFEQFRTRPNVIGA